MTLVVREDLQRLLGGDERHPAGVERHEIGADLQFLIGRLNLLVPE